VNCRKQKEGILRANVSQSAAVVHKFLFNKESE